ncbi:MAG: hypothetical protein HQM04_18120 [Magnetococcales bacterium]|nr:hypothetical protein [Magnetococcales bacterium]MBF0116944.1 hypothetical protein [Magnetococcales bacterium]
MALPLAPKEVSLSTIQHVAGLATREDVMGVFMGVSHVISASGWRAVYKGRTEGHPHIIVTVAAFGLTSGSGLQRVVGFGSDGSFLPPDGFIGFSQDCRPSVFVREFSTLAEIREGEGR